MRFFYLRLQFYFFLDFPRNFRPRCRVNCAGTGGYRPFEVLLRVRQQTTAVDMWSCGVICLCFAGGKFPFFNAIKNDLEGLAELASVFGTDKMIEAAAKLGKRLVFSEPLAGYDLGEFCAQIRGVGAGCSKESEKFPKVFYELMDSLLVLEPAKRISASDALMHPFLTSSL